MSMDRYFEFKEANRTYLSYIRDLSHYSFFTKLLMQLHIGNIYKHIVCEYLADTYPEDLN